MQTERKSKLLMSWHEFIFSEQKSVRYLRHVVFWLAWWLFFTGTYYSWWMTNTHNIYVQHTGIGQLGIFRWILLVFSKSFFLLLIHACGCYAFISGILPRFLQNRNYVHLLTGISAISLFLVTSGYFVYSLIFPLLDGAFHFVPDAEKNTLLWSSISAGLLNAPKVIALATIIRLLKRWWLKQKEKERLEKEKIEAELELLKAQIHPHFLFNSLNNIYAFARVSSPKAPEMLLKLSDILSYMLYECNEVQVPLEKEIKMLKDYMSLEKIRFGDRLEMNIRVTGNIQSHLIAPLLLLRFIENSFKQCGIERVEQPWINLEIHLENDSFYMKLINGKSVNKKILPYSEEDNLGQSQKRLILLYPGQYELKVVEEPEIFLVNLEIVLQRISEPASVYENNMAHHTVEMDPAVLVQP